VDETFRPKGANENELQMVVGPFLPPAIFKPCVSASDATLLQRASSVRDTISDFPTMDNLYFPSAYTKPDGSGMRGFCNWIVPCCVMVGQYPGQSPIANMTLKHTSLTKQYVLTSWKNNLGYRPTAAIIGTTTNNLFLRFLQFQPFKMTFLVQHSVRVNG
jgi:hypothetical protein